MTTDLFLLLSFLITKFLKISTTKNTKIYHKEHKEKISKLANKNSQFVIYQQNRKKSYDYYLRISGNKKSKLKSLKRKIIFHFSLFIIHFSLFIFHFSFFIIHFSLFIFHYSFFIIHSYLLSSKYDLFGSFLTIGKSCPYKVEPSCVREIIYDNLFIISLFSVDDFSS